MDIQDLDSRLWDELASSHRSQFGNYFWSILGDLKAVAAKTKDTDLATYSANLHKALMASGYKSQEQLDFAAFVKEQRNAYLADAAAFQVALKASQLKNESQEVPEVTPVTVDMIAHQFLLPAPPKAKKSAFKVGGTVRFNNKVVKITDRIANGQGGLTWYGIRSYDFKGRHTIIYRNPEDLEAVS